MTILTTIKKSPVGISENDYSYDADILLYINTTLAILSQLGLNEADKLPIINEDHTWEDLLGDRTDLEMVKTYIGSQVKLMFDPPSSTAALESLKRSIAELEWRITNLSINKGVTPNDTKNNKRR